MTGRTGEGVKGVVSVYKVICRSYVNLACLIYVFLIQSPVQLFTLVTVSKGYFSSSSVQLYKRERKKRERYYVVRNWWGPLCLEEARLSFFVIRSHVSLHSQQVLLVTY